MTAKIKVGDLLPSEGVFLVQYAFTNQYKDIKLKDLVYANYERIVEMFKNDLGVVRSRNNWTHIDYTPYKTKIFKIAILELGKNIGQFKSYAYADPDGCIVGDYRFVINQLTGKYTREDVKIRNVSPKHYNFTWDEIVNKITNCVENDEVYIYWSYIVELSKLSDKLDSEFAKVVESAKAKYIEQFGELNK